MNNVCVGLVFSLNMNYVLEVIYFSAGGKITDGSIKEVFSGISKRLRSSKDLIQKDLM